MFKPLPGGKFLDTDYGSIVSSQDLQSFQAQYIHHLYLLHSQATQHLVPTHHCPANQGIIHKYFPKLKTNVPHLL